MDMTLGQMLRRLASIPADRELGQLEPNVWRRIEALRTPRSNQMLAPARMFAVTGALVVGIALGGVQAATATAGSSEASIFSARPDLAPSTLLDAR